MNQPPTTSFGETTIIKVTPGKLSKYISDRAAVSILNAEDERTSVTYSESTRIPATFKMYLYQLKLSKVCMTFIKEKLENNISLSIYWNIFDCEDRVTSPEKLDQNKAKFDFVIKNRLEVGQEFMDKVKENPLTFRLYAENKHNKLFLSEAQFFIGDIIDVVNAKQEQRIYFTSNIIDPNGDIIAYLDTWYKFTCKQKSLKTLFPTSKVEGVKKKKSTKMGHLLGSAFSRRSLNFSTVYVTDSEFDHFADSVLLVLNRNKVLKTTQSDINTELEERVKWLRFEANWKQTLQEHAILHGKNPEDVTWRQWREEDTANVRLRTYDNVTLQTYEPVLSVTIVDLYFLQGCPLLKNDDITQFYIEYSFLNQSGPHMETPFSLPKAKAEEKIKFNFKKKFPIDLQKDLKNCMLLSELIKSDGVIKMFVISEPKEDEEKYIQTCQQIGYAEVSFNELIQLQENQDIFEYEVIDINSSIILLGYITVKVDGILAMRKMALDYMAPKGYKLYV